MKRTNIYISKKIINTYFILEFLLLVNIWVYAKIMNRFKIKIYFIIIFLVIIYKMKKS